MVCFGPNRFDPVLVTNLQLLVFPLQHALSLRQNRQQGGHIQTEDAVRGDARRLVADPAQGLELMTKGQNELTGQEETESDWRRGSPS